jgi:hypothetical protein
MTFALTQPGIGSTNWGAQVNANWTTIQNALNATSLSVDSFGAVGDAKRAGDVTTTASSATLTSASNPWALGDVGKAIHVTGAGAGSATLSTTIASFVSAGQITISVAATTAHAGVAVVWGTNDTAAIQAAVDAVAPTGGTIFFGRKNYWIQSKITATGRSGIIIVGQGINTVIFQTLAGVTGNHFLFTDCSYCQVRDIALVGEGINSFGAAGGVSFKLTSAPNNIGHNIEGVQITDIASLDGLFIQIPVQCQITHCLFARITENGLNLNAGTSTVIQSCYSLTILKAGYAFTGMTYSTLLGCACDNAGIGYFFSVSCRAIAVVGSGQEAALNRSVGYPGTGFTVDNSTVTLTSCFSRDPASGNHVVEQNGGVASRFDFTQSTSSVIARYSKSYRTPFAFTAGATYTIARTDDLIIVNKATGSATSVSMPSAPLLGDTFTIKDGKGDANTNNITVAGNGHNIDGAASFVLNTAFSSLSVTYDGSLWRVLSKV